jgi:quinolinate synthase
MGTPNQVIEEINRLKKEKNAIILAHYYQNDEIQEVADYIGDSLELSKKAANTDADVIVFCGVRFMAETAKSLSPDKIVLLPAEDAGCLMADMILPEDVLAMKAEHPDAAVVCYVNTTTDIKAVSDYCVTSSNAVKVVQNVPEKEIIFVPDMNLGQYVAERVPEKTFYFFEGFCPTHHFIKPEEVLAMRAQEPDGVIMAHPECRPEVLKLVDFVGSTGQMIQFAKDTPNKKIIVCTEKGILYRLRRDNPDKEFILLSPNLICPNMKKIDLNILLESLKKMQHQIEVDEDMRLKALTALDRMLKFA